MDRIIKANLKVSRQEVSREEAEYVQAFYNIICLQRFNNSNVIFQSIDSRSR